MEEKRKRRGKEEKGGEIEEREEEPVLESVLVTDSKTVLGFLFSAPEVQFFWYPKVRF